MPNKRTLGLVVILAVVLFSGLGFSAPAYDVATNTYTYYSVSSVAVGDCIDFDTLSNTSQIDIVNCAGSDADLKISSCNGHLFSYETVGNSAVRITPAIMGTTSSDIHINCDKKQWAKTSTVYTNMYSICLYTTQGKYVQIHNAYCLASNNAVTVIAYKNETENPYLVTNHTTLINDSYIIATTNQKDVQYFIADLGYTEDETITGYGWEYFYDENQLYPWGSTHAYYRKETDYTNTLNEVACNQLVNLQWTTESLYGINVPLGTFFTYCNNGSETYGLNKNYRYTVLKFINNTNGLLNVRFGMFTTNFNSIFWVRHYPLNPIGNMSVTVSWFSIALSDSTLYWRNQLIGTSGYSSWVTQYKNESVAQHIVVINGTDILQDYQYQYYVKSGTGINNNSGLYYNFTVLGSGGYATGGGAGGSYMENATSSLAKNLGESQILTINLFAILILAVALVGTIWFTGNPILTVAVFIVGVSMFTLFGFLPYYMFIIIAIIVALGMVKLIGGIIG